LLTIAAMYNVFHHQTVCSLSSAISVFVSLYLKADSSVIKPEKCTH